MTPTSEPYTDPELDRMTIDGFVPCCADDLAPRLFATIRRLRAEPDKGAGRVNAWTLAREILTPHGIDQRRWSPGQKRLERIVGAIPRLLVFGAIAAAVALGGWLDDLGRPQRHQRPRTNPPRPIP
ncbi:MAG UNVERIFIED_CONTAM: hypothetical protein LOD86_01425 [Thermobifida fusca]